MHRFMLERLQDKHVQRTLEQLGGCRFLGHGSFLDILGESRQCLS
jgi:hypothetical protein